MWEEKGDGRRRQMRPPPHFTAVITLSMNIYVQKEWGG